jgi:hypothetical protein
VFSTPSGNYNGPTLTGSPTLTVSAAPVLNVSLIGTPGKLYGGTDPLPGGASVSIVGAVNATVTDWNGNATVINDTPAGRLSASLTATTRVAGENVGTYAYTGGTVALSGTATGNYAGANFVPGGSVLNISPASLSITANDASRPFGSANPAFSASYSGFVFGETPTALTGTINFTTPATVLSPLGNYVIVPSGQTSTNYTINYVNGTLAVTSPGAAGIAALIANGTIPSNLQGAAFLMLGLKNYAQLWSDCLGGGSASGGSGVAGGGQASCGGGGGGLSTEIQRSLGF